MKIDPYKIYEEVTSLVGSTTYRKRCLIEEAPDFTDCLTAIYHIFKKALNYDLPLYYIGDMPRMLVKLHSWKILEVSSNELQDGDLVFVKLKKGLRVISHVAMYIKGKLFHSCQFRKTGHLESVDDFFGHYEQSLSKDGFLQYIDKRNI